MLQCKRKDVAVIPVFDSERIGSFIKPIAVNHMEKKKHIQVMDAETNKVIFETEDEDKAIDLMRKRKRDGKRSKYMIKEREESLPIPAGERCDQGVVKYIGCDVKDVKVGDYVFFSGYTGTLMDIEDEGLFIIMQEKFIICTYDIDQFMEIPGLYFMDTFGKPIPATFEMAMNIIASTFMKLGKTIDVKGEGMRLEDYNVGVENG